MLQLSQEPNTTFLIMLIMKKKIYAQKKNNFELRKKSLANGEKLIGNYYYPGNPDVCAGSCNNAIVKILI